MRTRRCPECGSERIARTAFGMPLAKDADDERVFWLGCVVDPELEHRYGCHECGALFGHPVTTSPTGAR
ncbi:hypothetical protein [Humibacter ginsenosidimutans]|uniref:Uncharacterized protein n=1 Tax=Humibacter ginsenosidimutans TaxID=2599293 RepID=A0A5B8M305_9MICO|nr:hypothetical protein [Humibacter ginsenosidimutans]QDZ14165.1 hypothetical protein FPZ11_04695 [Humibacter ginsenosidimutans]